MAPLRLKGKGEPVPVYRVLGRSRITTRFEARAHRGLTPFVGRAGELVRLSAAFDRVSCDAGASRLAHVIGDAGVGKTRFLEQFRRQLPGDALSYVGCCESYGNVPPLLPFLQVLRQVFGLAPDAKKPAALAGIEARLRPLDERLLRHLPAFLQALSLEPLWSSQKLRLMPYSRRYQRRSVRCCPPWPPSARCCWCWTTGNGRRRFAPSARRFFGRAQRESSSGLGGGGGAHTGGGGPAVARRRAFRAPTVRCRGSGSGGVRALAECVELSVKDVIQERSGGNPLFLEELCQAWPDDAVAGAEMSATRRVPNTLHGLIQARVERLPTRLLDVVRAAAVVGSEFDQWSLEQVMGGAQLGKQLEALAENHLIYESSLAGVYRFNHGITREVVYDSVKLSERRRLHGAIAVSTEARFGPDGLAAHCEDRLSFRWRAEHERAANYASLRGQGGRHLIAGSRAPAYRAALTELDRLPRSSRSVAVG